MTDFLNELKKVIRIRMIMFVVIAILSCGVLYFLHLESFWRSICQSIILAILAAAMYSWFVGAVMLLKFNFMWKHYRQPNYLDTIWANPYNYFSPFSYITNEVLNEDGIEARNKMLAQLAVFCLGWLIAAIPLVTVSFLFKTP